MSIPFPTYSPEIATIYGVVPGRLPRPSLHSSHPLTAEVLGILAEQEVGSTSGTAPTYTVAPTSVTDALDYSPPSYVALIKQQTIETAASSTTPSDIAPAQCHTPGGSQKQGHDVGDHTLYPPRATAVALRQSSEYGTFQLGIPPFDDVPCSEDDIEWHSLGERCPTNQEELATIAKKLEPDMVMDPHQITDLWLVGDKILQAFSGRRRYFARMNVRLGLPPCSGSEASESEKDGRFGLALMKLGRQMGW
jgi:hypothetical protein